MRQGEKSAVQTRAVKTRNKLVDALAALLQDTVYEDITVADIARQAGVSVGTVYRRFENKDAFIPVVFDLYLERLTAFAQAQPNTLKGDAPDNLYAAVLSLTELGWRFIEQENYLVRAAHLHARTRPDLVGDDWHRLLEEAVSGYVQLLTPYTQQIVVADIEEAARMVLYLLNIGLAEYGLYSDQGAAAALKLDSDGFVRSLARSVYGYLTTPVEH